MFVLHILLLLYYFSHPISGEILDSNLGPITLSSGLRARFYQVDLDGTETSADRRVLVANKEYITKGKYLGEVKHVTSLDTNYVKYTSPYIYGFHIDPSVDQFVIELRGYYKPERTSSLRVTSVVYGSQGCTEKVEPSILSPYFRASSAVYLNQTGSDQTCFQNNSDTSKFATLYNEVQSGSLSGMAVTGGTYYPVFTANTYYPIRIVLLSRGSALISFYNPRDGSNYLSFSSKTLFSNDNEDYDALDENENTAFPGNCPQFTSSKANTRRGLMFDDSERLVKRDECPASSSSTSEIPSSSEIQTSLSEIITSSSEIMTSSSEIPTSSSEVVTSSSEIITSSSEIPTSSSEIITSSSEIIASSSEIPTSSSEVVTSSSEILSSSETLTSASEIIISSSEIVSSSEIGSSSEVITSSSEIVSSSEVFTSSSETISSYSDIFTSSASETLASSEIVTSSSEYPSSSTSEIVTSSSEYLTSSEIVSESITSSEPEPIQSSTSDTSNIITSSTTSGSSDISNFQTSSNVITSFTGTSDILNSLVTSKSTNDATNIVTTVTNGHTITQTCTICESSKFTTEQTKRTTGQPEVTTKLPDTTIQKSEVTTKLPSTTTQQLEVTSQQPRTTTIAYVTTKDGTRTTIITVTNYPAPSSNSNNSQFPTVIESSETQTRSGTSVKPTASLFSTFEGQAIALTFKHIWFVMILLLV
ncbi:hypothetical protein C6P45_002480 [Maudiozyma exigua]|uniref:Uncharacterized protein n=1 Tax=Maudiozyma exigua TaxID=34358 RepID=A0A9P6WDP6_MAUEX|nr:hypothetical protein C6P45_002480 [Kazachstania exigua]